MELASLYIQHTMVATLPTEFHVEAIERLMHYGWKFYGPVSQRAKHLACIVEAENGKHYRTVIQFNYLNNHTYKLNQCVPFMVLEINDINHSGTGVLDKVYVDPTFVDGYDYEGLGVPKDVIDYCIHKISEDFTKVK